MDKMIVEHVDSKAASRRARATPLKTRRVLRDDGTLETIHLLDARSPNVGDQFLRLFQLNVARARRETREMQKKRGIAAE